MLNSLSFYYCFIAIQMSVISVIAFVIHSTLVEFKTEWWKWWISYSIRNNRCISLHKQMYLLPVSVWDRNDIFDLHYQGMIQQLPVCLGSCIPWQNILKYKKRSGKRLMIFLAAEPILIGDYQIVHLLLYVQTNVTSTTVCKMASNKLFSF